MSSQAEPLLFEGVVVLEDQLVVNSVNLFTGVNEGATATKVVDGLQITLDDGGYAAAVGMWS